jgi:4-hydroxy-2-oxoheptanedioate aldolase
MTPGDLRRRLAEGGPLLGALLRMPAESLAEMVAVAGLDCVLLDLEHGPADLVSLQHHVLAAQVHGVPTLVRVGADEPALVLRCLDLGVVGIVFPHVSSAEDARRAVAAAHYPPLGQRGFASYSRAGLYGATPSEQHLDAGADTVVIIMVEDAAGCAAAAEILAVDGVDGVFVGPADLSVSLGLRGDAQHPDVLAASRDVHEAAAKASAPSSDRRSPSSRSTPSTRVPRSSSTTPLQCSPTPFAASRQPGGPDHDACPRPRAVHRSVRARGPERWCRRRARRADHPPVGPRLVRQRLHRRAHPGLGDEGELRPHRAGRLAELRPVRQPAGAARLQHRCCGHAERRHEQPAPALQRRGLPQLPRRLELPLGHGHDRRGDGLLRGRHPQHPDLDLPRLHQRRRRRRLLFTVLGQDDTGGIIWGPSVLRDAAGHGLYLRADNTIVDTAAGQPLPARTS